MSLWRGCWRPWWKSRRRLTAGPASLCCWWLPGTRLTAGPLLRNIRKGGLHTTQCLRSCPGWQLSRSLALTGSLLRTPLGLGNFTWPRWRGRTRSRTSLLLFQSVLPSWTSRRTWCWRLTWTQIWISWRRRWSQIFWWRSRWPCRICQAVVGLGEARRRVLLLQRVLLNLHLHRVGARVRLLLLLLQVFSFFYQGRGAGAWWARV